MGHPALVKAEGGLRNLLYAGPVLLLAFALRAFRLDGQSLWYDEGNSAALATRSISQIVSGAAADIHPPLYYILLSWWSQIGGASEFSLRFLSVAFGLLLVAVIYKLGQKLFLPQAGLAAAGIAAVSPFLVYYSQEARMYAQGAFLCALAGLFFVRALEKDRYWPAYTLAAAAALYTQYYTMGVILAFNVFFVLALMWRSERSLWLRWLVANLMVAALYLPWLPALLNQAAMWPRGSPVVEVATQLSPQAYNVVILGPVQLGNPTSIAAVFQYGLPAIALLAIAAIVWPALGGALRVQPVGIMGRWMGLLFILAVVLISWFSLLLPVWKSPFHAKFLSFGLPWFQLWLGLGAVSLTGASRRFFHFVSSPVHRGRTRVLGVPWPVPFILPTMLALLSFGIAVYIALQSYYFDPSSARDDYRGLAAFIEAQSRSRDAIVLNAPGQNEVMGYYYQGQLPVYRLPKQRPIEEGTTALDLEALATGHDRLWLVLWGQQESDPQDFIERWLDRRGFKSLDRWFGGVRLALYSMSPAGEARVRVDARLGNYARLVEVTFPGTAAGREDVIAWAASGDIIPVSIQWEAISATPQRLKVFVHLLGLNATLWGQHDAEPVGGSRPTTDWRPGQSFQDNHGIPIPPGTPPGKYEIEIGMYDMTTGQRLTVFDAAGAATGDRVVLQPVGVVKPDSFPSRSSLNLERSLEARFQDVSLLGYEFFKLGTERDNLDFRQGNLAHLALFWQAGASTKPANYALRVAVLDSTNKELPASDIMAGYDYPADRWTPGEVVRAQYKIQLPTSSGIYRLAVYVKSGEDKPPIPPTGPALKLIDGKLLLTEFQVK